MPAEDQFLMKEFCPSYQVHISKTQPSAHASKGYKFTKVHDPLKFSIVASEGAAILSVVTALVAQVDV